MLVAKHVRKEFGSVVAVADVTFSVPAGATFGLIGPNGAGKTTTMRMIVGVLTPDGGSITWNGETIHGAMRRRFGYLPEERGIYGKMGVHEQIAYFGRLHGLAYADAAARAHQWIARLDLEKYAQSPCAELSKGNQQKVQVACAAVHGPELLVLDEPFSGLDPVNAEMLLRVLLELKAQGTTLILSSHHMWQLETLCSAYCIVAGGVDRASGTLAELRAAWPTRVIRVAPATPNVLRVIGAVNGARPLPRSSGIAEYEVPRDTPFSQILRRLVEVEAIAHFEAVEPSLHDIYIHAVGAEEEC
jgi:ABC-2 type transport system ATP-binding protein